MRQVFFAVPALLLTLAVTTPAPAQRRLVLIDQDGSGPGGSNQMAMMVLLQSPKVEVLGITMVTGNAWRDEETAHTLRMLELIHRSDVPVAKGAVFPLVRTQKETELEAKLVGNVDWLGAWRGGPTTLAEPNPASPANSASPARRQRRLARRLGRRPNESRRQRPPRESPRRSVGHLPENPRPLRNPAHARGRPAH